MGRIKIEKMTKVSHRWSKKEKEDRELVDLSYLA